MCNLSVTVIAGTIDAEKVHELNRKCGSILILLDNIRSPNPQQNSPQMNLQNQS